MSAVTDLILDFLYPRDVTCLLCGEEGLISNGICEDCLGKIRYAPKMPSVPSLDGITCPFLYAPPVSTAVLRLKYTGAAYLADYFASCITLPDSFMVDCIVPVPLHKRRQAERGYNQSELLAGVFSKLHPALTVRTDLLERSRYTMPQQKLSGEERRKNLKNAFSVKGNVSGMNILLMDDVTTTGSTLSVCADTLKKAGAARVYAACICTVPD